MWKLKAILKRLEDFYGPPPKQKLRDPFEMMLWEMSAELATDEKRGAAFQALKKRIGSTPKKIAAASPLEMVEVTKLGGMEPARRAKRMQDAAVLAIEEFGGNLRSILKRPLKDAVKALRKFPSVGGPGAEKILLLTRSYPLLALESNGLRVLRRLGYGPPVSSNDGKDYAAGYRAVREALAPQVAAAGFDTLIAAHHLLRRHGKELCKTSRPLCAKCPLARDCPSDTL